jgi:hypothetical protein
MYNLAETRAQRDGWSSTEGTHIHTHTHTHTHKNKNASESMRHRNDGSREHGANNVEILDVR